MRVVVDNPYNVKIRVSSYIIESNKGQVSKTLVDKGSNYLKLLKK